MFTQRQRVPTCVAVKVSVKLKGLRESHQRRYRHYEAMGADAKGVAGAAAVDSEDRGEPGGR